MDHPVILFDGVCNLCNGAVQFIIKRDPNAIFRFANLQSDAGQDILKRHRLPTEDFDTMVLIQDERVFTKSTAALRILRRLGGVWQLVYASVVLPRFVRDSIYRLIAHHRYSWFGKRKECMVPTADLKSRFLE